MERRSILHPEQKLKIKLILIGRFHFLFITSVSCLLSHFPILNTAQLLFWWNRRIVFTLCFICSIRSNQSWHFLLAGIWSSPLHEKLIKIFPKLLVVSCVHKAWSWSHVFIYFRVLFAGTKNTNICRPHLKSGTHVSLYSQYARGLSGNIKVLSLSIRSKRHFHQQESRPVNRPFVCQTEGVFHFRICFQSLHWSL